MILKQFTDGCKNLHCDTGPALVLASGRTEWWQHGHLHREDGPAIDCPEVGQMWYKNHIRHRIGGPAVIFKDGDEEWYQYGRLHREDGPAKVLGSGSFWYKNGTPHREDGPAFMYADGEKRWYEYGAIHRTDGPAISHPCGTREYFVKGRQFTEDEFYRYVDTITGEVLVPVGKALTYMCPHVKR